MKVLRPNEVTPEVVTTGKVLIFLTSTRCHACHELSKIFYEFRQHAEDDVIMIHVNDGEDVDPKRYMPQISQVTGWPFTVIYRDGKLRDFWYGINTIQAYYERLNGGLR